MPYKYKRKKTCSVLDIKVTTPYLYSIQACYIFIRYPCYRISRSTYLHYSIHNKRIYQLCLRQQYIYMKIIFDATQCGLTVNRLLPPTSTKGVEHLYLVNKYYYIKSTFSYIEQILTVSYL